MDEKRPIIDRAIAQLSPAWALKREIARRQLGMSAQVYTEAYQNRVGPSYPRSMSMTGLRPLRRFELIRMRDRARSLDRQNAIASGMLDRAVENVIGKGMTLQARTKNKEFNLQVEELWRDRCDKLDVRGLCSWGELQRIMFRSHLRDGDVGAIMMRRAGVPFIQPVGGDWIDSKKTAGLDTPNKVHGVILDEFGKPIAFTVRNMNSSSYDETEVPARNFIFMPRLKELDNVRGEPVFATAFPYFDQIDGYVEAVILAARMAACFGAVVKSPAGVSGFAGLGQTQNSQNRQQRIAQLEPGMIQYLNAGEEIQQVTPQQPTQNFPDFVAALLRFAGLNLGLPLELVMLDFSRTNYSSARASLLQAYRSFRTLQQRFIDQFLSRVYPWWLSVMVKNGDIIVPDDIADSYWDHKWMAPGWAWVDPTKEIQAAAMALDMGITSLSQIAGEQGNDLASIFEARQHEIDTMEEKGIPICHSAMTRDPLALPAIKPDLGKPEEPDEEIDERNAPALAEDDE